MAKEKKKRKVDNCGNDETSAKKQKVDAENSAKYERQKKLAAERQRRFKERMSEEQLEKKRERDRERRRRLREKKIIKPIAEMKAADQKKQRTQWKKYSATYRQKQKNLKDALRSETPPDSEVDEPAPLSTQRERGRKKVRHDRAKSYRTITKQAEEIKNLKRRLYKYKKRLQREKNKNKSCLSSPSPAKQVRDLVGRERVSPKIKKRLFVGFALQKQLETQVKTATQKGKERQLMAKAIGNKILKKYRVQHHLKKVVTYKYNKVQKANESGNIDLNYSRKKYETVKVKEAQALKNFFEDDSVSKMCPGKCDFVRKGKQKIQRRILLNSMKNLYQKFIDETKLQISYATFTRSRPFWVTAPKAKDRDTCACMKHENVEFLIAALKNANVIKQKNSNEILKELVCSQDNEICMSHKCKKCKYNMIQFNLENDERLKYFKWEKVIEERNIKGQCKKIRRVIKKECYARASDIVERLMSSLPLFRAHVYSLIHQARQLKTLKNELKKGAVLFHIDFSQNYVCKMSTEIQSMHFGASKKQISLHTVVRYHMEDDLLKTKSFCTASDNLDHHCHGVWAHLQPVFKQTADELPEIESVHIFSDGPTSQYKNKGNVYLMKTLLPNCFKKLKSFTWNYSEPGHGKGAMDGVGGSVKRSADNFVKYGNDITCSSDLVKCLKDNSTTTMAEITDGEFQEVKKMLPTKLPDIKGIMQIRQFTYGENNMYGRKLSCFNCKSSQKCDHYHVLTLSQDQSNQGPSSNQNKKRKPRPQRKKVLQVGDETSSDEELFGEGVNVGKDSKLKHRPQRKTSSKILHVDDVYTSSDEEVVNVGTDSPPKFVSSHVSRESIVQGAYVVVSYENVSKKGKQCQNYLGIVQSPVGEDDEVKILFMKGCAKDKSMFTTDESDVPYVSLNQIKSLLPNPKIVLKGDRVFYKFQKNIVL